MDYLNPIFTETTTCQDCYKCLRECSVKAIQIEKSCARILPEECTLCGHCVAVCPVGAKKVRDDSGRFKALRQNRTPLVALLAPSWVCEFPFLSPQDMKTRLLDLGFSQVMEVSSGAQAANQACVKTIREAGADRRLFISSACPTIVRYLHRYQPDLAEFILDVESPLELTARMAKERFGINHACVFFGPCIAKKSESDRNRRLIDAALTYRDLDRLFEEAGSGTAKSREDSRNYPVQAPTPGQKNHSSVLPSCQARAAAAAKAHLYPIDGGMTAGIRQIMGSSRIDTMVFSGMVHVRQALEGMRNADLDSPLFLELMACEGGCVNGPQTRLNSGTIIKRLEIIKAQKRDLECLPPPQGPSSLQIRQSVNYICATDQEGKSRQTQEFTDEDLRQSLAKIGKHSHEDELNCSACGYDSCRDFARACLMGKAETTMCVSWMRNLVEKKANALLAAMPSGVVILDRDLKIVESNRNFARMMGGETEELFDLHPGLVGADGKLILPRPDLFMQILESPGTRIEEDLSWGGRILHCHIFGIEAGQVAGGLFEDVTIPTVQRDRVVQQAQEVIEKHLSVVQQIAWLLGENAAESESILNSIIQSFSPPSPELLPKQNRQDEFHGDVRQMYGQGKSPGQGRPALRAKP